MAAAHSAALGLWAASAWQHLRMRSAMSCGHSSGTLHAQELTASQAYGALTQPLLRACSIHAEITWGRQSRGR